MHSSTEVLKLFGKGEFSAKVCKYHMIAEYAIEAQCLTYFDVELAAHVRVSRGERPEVFQKAVHKHNILLVYGVQNMLNMDVGQSTIAKVLMDESTYEFDAYILYFPSYREWYCEAI